MQIQILFIKNEKIILTIKFKKYMTNTYIFHNSIDLTIKKGLPNDLA